MGKMGEKFVGYRRGKGGRKEESEGGLDKVGRRGNKAPGKRVKQEEIEKG